MDFFTYKDFLESLHVLHGKGQTFSRPYGQAFDAYTKASNKKSFDVVFLGLKKTNHGEKRIRHTIKYDIGRGCRLVTIQHKDKCVFLYAGEHTAADEWLDKNRGLSVVIGKDTGEITTLYKTKNGEKDQRPITSQNPGQFKLISELSQEDQSLLLDGVDYQILRKILELNSWDTDDIILESIEGLNDQDKADLLIDVLLLLRDKKNKFKIEKRINDYKGEYISFEDVNEENLEIYDGSDEIIKLNPVDVHATKIALESADYRSWMLYMHPDQEKIVKKDYKGPALLKGVSGSGKTAVVVNRAIRLAKIYPDEKIAILTLNKALAKLIDDLVSSASGGLDNLVVKSFWQLCIEQLAIFEPKNNRHYDESTWGADETIDEIWQEYYHQETNNYDANIMFPLHQSLLARSVYPEEYIKEEFDFIRSALSLEMRKDYLEMDREGRSIAMPPNYREYILKGLGFWEAKMQAVGSVDYLGVTTALYQYIDRIKPLYRSVLVDEMQDFGTLELKIVRQLVKENSNDIFLAGDTVQRVHTKQHDYKKAGINIVGRSMSINQNYRNSREILEAANNVLEENLTGTDYVAAEIEFLQPKFAESSKYAPYLLEAETVSEEITSAVQYLQEILIDEGRGHNGCIAVAGYQLSELKDLAKQLRIQLLDGEIDLQNKAIFLSDLEQTKGFEFDHMIIVSCSEKILPNPNLPPEEAFRDLSRFYVAMTRARKNLIISYSGKMSRFIKNSTSYFLDDEWKNQVVLKNTVQIKAPCATGRVERFLFNPDEYSNKTDYGALPARDLLLTRQAIGMSQARQDRLLKYITGIRKSAQSPKSNTWRNLNELFKEAQITINIILAGGSENVVEEIGYYKDLFNLKKSKSRELPTQVAENLCSSNVDGNTTDQPVVSAWSVILENTGKCMHCGRPSIPGDYVCLQCNPG
jgi:superfamily I DNA/RNA helicase